MKKLEGLNFFENLLTSPQNELVNKAIKEGKIGVGFNCYVVPEALLSAGNLFPVWLTAPDVTSTPQSDYYLSMVACSYCKSVLEAGIEGTYDLLGAMVFAPTCDHIRRSGQHFDLLKINNKNEKFFFHMIDAPFKIADNTIDWYTMEMKKVAAKFNEEYNSNINEDSLREAIKELNEFNMLLKSIGDMRKEKNPKLTGTEWHKIYGATKVAPKYLLIEPLKKIKAEIQARVADGNDDEIRLMFVGSTFDKPEFTKLVEEQGGVVVADRYCFGSLPGMEPIEEEGDPFVNLAKYYLGTCECPRMMQRGKERLKYTEKLIEEYSVDGIIFETMVFCDLWSYEGVMFSDIMKKIDMPFVSIEREYALSGEGQIRTRVQAFLESIKSKREREALKFSK